VVLIIRIAAVFGQGRAIIDWNARNPFCASCGQPTLSINAGYKRTCPEKDNGVDRKPCPTRKGLHNIAFPRTDPTVIMAIISSDGKKLLLGRQKRYPPDWYSTLAGFCEPAESVEEAVRREVWEESGVVVGRVIIHSTQPWPFPANLMIGAIGQAIEGKEEIKLDYDPELEAAKWVPFDEVSEALQNGVSGLGEDPPSGYEPGGLRLPPNTAIANQLLQAVVSGWATGGIGESKI
jgi:NAD+ diphosphatase